MAKIILHVLKKNKVLFFQKIPFTPIFILENDY